MFDDNPFKTDEKQSNHNSCQVPHSYGKCHLHQKNFMWDSVLCFP